MSPNFETAKKLTA